MRAAIRRFRTIISLSVIMIAMAGCGGSDAEEILLKESSAAQVTEKEAQAPEGEESTGETEASVQNAGEQTPPPVINVVCNCQCQAGNAQGQALPGTQESGTAVSPVQDGSVSQESGRVNINTADLAALTTLNGIGEVRAQAIISHRETYGAFQTIEDLKKVNGIKDGVYNRIKEDISVG